MRRLNRFFVLVVVGYGIIIAGAVFYYFRFQDEIHTKQSDIIAGFFASLVEDILFFGLVTLFAVLAQFSRSGGESLFSRLQRLFANWRIDHDIISYFIEQIKGNAVYSEDSQHTIEILEYNRELYSYRLSFENRYKLHNAFGDIPYKADLSIEIVPDIVREDLEVPAQVVTVRLERGSEKTEFAKGPLDIKEKAFSRVIELDLQPDEHITYLAQWWSWASNVGESGFSVKRFSKRFRIRIVNKSNVTPRIFSEGREHSLKYGEELVLSDLVSVPERTRVCFDWRPPQEHPEPDPISLRQEEGLLQYDVKIGEERQREL